MKKFKTITVIIDRLVHGGQGLGVDEAGKKTFVWGALPGEKVQAQITKNKKTWAEGFAVAVTDPSQNRITPKEPDIYLSTSPWQIINYKQEAAYKQAILEEAFTRENIDINWQKFYQLDQEYGYRNKMEYNFWFDKETEKISLALHKRGSHHKIAVNGSALASKAINMVGSELIKYINSHNIEGRQLKSVIFRSTKSGIVSISLFVVDKNIINEFKNFKAKNIIFEIIYSNPKSPASVATEILQTSDDLLNDSLLGKEFKYTTRSFFQVNLPVYEAVLTKIKNYLKKVAAASILDLYSGVGSIGLTVTNEDNKLTMIETDKEAASQAKLNIAGKNQQIITATAENALDYITSKETVIVDPPRAGLHSKVTKRLLETKPKNIIYLSCNPSTQARDIKELTAGGYKIISAQGYNFFPRTPHIESLIFLSLN